jgi:hypothetical protein
VEKMRITPEEKEKQFRVIFEAFLEDPRIFVNDISSLLGITRNAASNRLKEAFEKIYLSKPQIRRRSYINLKEYVYFLRCENPAEFFPTFRRDETVVYHALMSGFANLWVVSSKELTCRTCDIVVKGARSDYHVSIPPDHSWETAINNMRKMVEEFNPETYTPEGIIETHWDETVEWDSEYETLFREFNYDLRRPITPIIRKNLISWTKLEKWLKNLSKYCTIITHYYPKTISVYDPYLFMFETDYEDFLIDLFSQLPTSSLFFKVSNKLFLYAHIRREYLRVVNSQVDIGRLHIPFLITSLLKKGVIRNEAHAIVECYWQDEPYPGTPP